MDERDEPLRRRGNDSTDDYGYAVGQPPGYNTPPPSQQQWAQAPSQQQQWAQPPMPPAKRKRTVPLWATIVTGIVAFAIGAAAGSGTKKTDKTANATPATVVTTMVPGPAVTITVTAQAPAAATSAAPAPAKATTPPAPAAIGEGTYIVGTDIKPGLYKTSGPTDTSLPDCYWERDKDLDGGINSIIANDNAKGQTTVKIAATDKAFKTSGCAPWVKIG